MPTTDRLQAALSDRYAIERPIGSGGMATVYLARDLKHDREVALKVLRADLSAVIGTERFLSEVRIAAKLDHPHILTLIDSGEADGLLYYVLPYVRGESLRAKLEREKQLGMDEALSITKQVASALDYAHAQGVVHRDIKPENILLHEGEAVLTDFGIALAVKEAGGNRLTETGLSLGTPQYMSPEQATGDRTLDKRSDIYSLGAVYYEMIAGEPPVTGATAQVVIAKLLTEKPVRLSVVRSTISPGIDRAIDKALAKVPADRFKSAGEFARAGGSRSARFANECAQSRAEASHRCRSGPHSGTRRTSSARKDGVEQRACSSAPRSKRPHEFRTRARAEHFPGWKNARVCRDRLPRGRMQVWDRASGRGWIGIETAAGRRHRGLWHRLEL